MYEALDKVSNEALDTLYSEDISASTWYITRMNSSSSSPRATLDVSDGCESNSTPLEMLLGIYILDLGVWISRSKGLKELEISVTA